ncbi:ribonuclease P protein component [bacterium]|nr:MAG: ribonuclease P protein component [bacterium]
MDSHAESQSDKKFVYRRRHRLSGGAQFAAVFEAKLRKSRGVITVFLLATEHDEHRLGLSVGRRVGNAVVRGRFKRMMREVFRHQRTEFPVPNAGGAYDIVITTRKHDALSVEEYSKLVVEAVEAAHRIHEKRAGR